MPEIDFQPFTSGYFKFVRVQPQLTQNGGVKIGHVMGIFDRVKAEFISGSVDRSSFDPAAGQPHAETERVVISTTVILPAGRTAELGAADDECFIQQASLFQIGQ